MLPTGQTPNNFQGHLRWRGRTHARSRNTNREGGQVRADDTRRCVVRVLRSVSRRGDNVKNGRRRKRKMCTTCAPPGHAAEVKRPNCGGGRHAFRLFLTRFPSYPSLSLWCPLSNAAAVVRWLLFPGFEYCWGAFDLSQRRRRR